MMGLVGLVEVRDLVELMGLKVDSLYMFMRSLLRRCLLS